MTNKRKRIVRPEDSEEESDYPSRTRAKVNYQESTDDSSGEENEVKQEKDDDKSMMVNLSIGTELAKQIEADQGNEGEENGNGDGGDNHGNGNDNDNDNGEDEDEDSLIPRSRKTARKGPSRSKKENDDDSEFREDDEEDDDIMSASAVSEEGLSDGRGFIDDDDDDFASKPKKRRLKKRKQLVKKVKKKVDSSDEYMDEGVEELSDEIRELKDDSPEATPKKHLRARKNVVNYQLLPPPPVDEQELNSRQRAPPSGHRKLFPTTGPFGGSDTVPLFGNQENEESDKSDDEMNNKPLGTPGAGFGKVKKNQLADSDPLGVDTNIDFNSVGGLDKYISQLKEMVSLPLMYPEVYQNFNVTPPRGVLFHGPPGTGKTLMARALAASCSSEGQKITFFMRKGADCLSKWVGEAERQLRLLFEEARNQQPSIIFFDEIDGLAPVRSSKQEQIHASIVSTLLALMDGMDNRGQVIVIGATNRPDSVDPALRRPGRFDREFYFPLPDLEARKQIISINTKDWTPPLAEPFVNEIAHLTKGYGGADLRAMCTEAALVAIQRRYPQIYSSNKKLLIDKNSIHVKAQDFMMSLDKIVPSSARSTSSGAAPLPARIEPLLKPSMDKVIAKLDHLFPRRKKLTPLEEAMYEGYDNDEDGGFRRQEAMKEFKSSRVFRPRLLIYGDEGMGQQYITSAVQHHLEGFHLQSFDLATLLSDSTRTPEAAITQLMVEVKRHTPSVIFLPNIDQWFNTVSDAARSTFFGIVRSLQPTEPVLILGMVEGQYNELHPEIKHLFGYSSENRQGLEPPKDDGLARFYEKLFFYIKSKPTDYPDPEQRPKRKLEVLPEAPASQQPTTTAGVDDETQKKKDQALKNTLRLKMNGTMEAIKTRFKKFRKPAIDESRLLHLYDPVVDSGDPALLTQYAYEKTADDMIRETATGRKYYNMEIETIEDRLWNGFYCEPKQLLKDVDLIRKDAETSGDRDRVVKSREMYANVQQWINELKTADPMFFEQCKEMHKRVKERARQEMEKQKEKEQLETIQEEEQENGHANVNVNGDAGGDGDGDVDMFMHDTPSKIPKEPSPIARPEAGQDQDQDQEPEPKPKPEPQQAEPQQAQEEPQRAQDGPQQAQPAPEPEPEPQREPEPEPEPEPQREPEREIELDETKLEEFKVRLIQESRNRVVEELEQLFSALIDVVWTNRHLWDRTEIVNMLESTLTMVAESMDHAKRTLLEDWNR